MKPSWSLPFPALAEADLVIKPGGCWPMWSRVYYCCFLENNSILWKHLREGTGPEGRTRPQLPLLCYMPILQATRLHLVVTGRFGPRWERCTLSGIREIAEGEACSPTVNNSVSGKHTGSVSYFDVGSVESGGLEVGISLLRINSGSDVRSLALEDGQSDWGVAFHLPSYSSLIWESSWHVFSVLYGPTRELFMKYCISYVHVFIMQKICLRPEVCLTWWSSMMPTLTSEN